MVVGAELVYDTARVDICHGEHQSWQIGGSCIHISQDNIIADYHFHDALWGGGGWVCLPAMPTFDTFHFSLYIIYCFIVPFPK